MKLSELNSDFQIKFLFLVLSFWKRIALVYFLKTDWSYTFLKIKISKQIFNLKKKFWNTWNLDFHGVKIAVTHFVTHFTHVYRHFAVYCRKQKNCLGKTVFKMWSQKLTKNSLKVHKTTFRKKCEYYKKLKQKMMKTFKIFGGFWGQNYYFW